MWKLVLHFSCYGIVWGNKPTDVSFQSNLAEQDWRDSPKWKLFQALFGFECKIKECPRPGFVTARNDTNRPSYYAIVKLLIPQSEKIIN